MCIEICSVKVALFLNASAFPPCMLLVHSSYKKKEKKKESCHMELKPNGDRYTGALAQSVL